MSSKQLKRHRLTAATLCSVVIFFVGCQRDSRLSFSGSVKLAGQTVKEGYIEFRPIAGAASPTAGSPIKEGRYVVSREQGLQPGTFRVALYAFGKAERNSFDPVSGEAQAVAEQLFPKQFNDDSTLEVKLDAATNIQDFNLPLPTDDS